MIDLDAIETLADIPSAWSANRGNEVAIKFFDRETTYNQLDRQSNRVANALRAAGLASGDRVSVLTKNHDLWFPLFFGTARARGCLAPINCRLAIAEISFILADTRPKFLFVGEDFFDGALGAIADLSDKPTLVALYGEHPQFQPLDDWLADATTDGANESPHIGDDVLQLYTSGTTGQPKGVVLTNRNYRTFLEAASEVDGFIYEKGEAVMIVMPLFHVAGTNVSFSGLAQGGRLVIVKDFAVSGVTSFFLFCLSPVMSAWLPAVEAPAAPGWAWPLALVAASNAAASTDIPNVFTGMSKPPQRAPWAPRTRPRVPPVRTFRRGAGSVAVAPAISPTIREAVSRSRSYPNLKEGGGREQRTPWQRYRAHH